MDPVTASLERSLARFAETAGVKGDHLDQKETSMPVVAAKTDAGKLQKLADEVIRTGPAQGEYAEDRGDYKTHSEIINDNKKDVRQSTPADNNPRGSQVQTQVDHGDYTLAMKVMETLAGANSKAIDFLTKRAAEGPSAVSESPSTSPAADMPELGAAPPEVEGEEAGLEATIPGSTMPGEGLPPVGGEGDMTSMKLKETIQVKEQDLSQTKMVVDELKKVLQDVNPTVAKKIQALFSRRKKLQAFFGRQAADEDKEEDKENAEQDKKDEKKLEKSEKEKDASITNQILNRGASVLSARVKELMASGKSKEEARRIVAVSQLGKTFTAAVSETRKQAADTSTQKGTKNPLWADKDNISGKDPNDSEFVLKDGDPDGSYEAQAKGKSEATIKPAHPLWYSDTSDEDYAHTAKIVQQSAKQVQSVVARLVKTGKTADQAKQIVASSVLGQTLVKAYTEFRQLRASKQAALENRANSLYEKVNSLVIAGKETGLSLKEALKEARNSPLGKGFLAVTDKIQKMQKDASGDSTYKSKEAGDKSADEISAGNVKTLASPETSKVTNSAQSEMDKRHSDSVKGSTTTASKSIFSPEERTKIAGQIKSLDNAFDAVKQVTENVSKFVATKHALAAVVKTVDDTLKGLKTTADTLSALAKSQDNSARQSLRDQVITARLQIQAAKEKAVLITSMAAEGSHHQAKFARVSPSFKLAMTMIEKGQAHISELPAKVAEFLALKSDAFKVVESTISNLPSVKTAGRREATRMPVVSTGNNAGADPLDGVFDD